MNKILLINLKENNDFFASTRIISAIKNEYPNSSITFLTLDSLQDEANILDNIDHIITFEKKKLISILNSQIYNKGFAVNLLSDFLSQVNSQPWSKIINYNNDYLSTYITSYLKLGQSENADTVGGVLNKSFSLQAETAFEAYYNGPYTKSANASFCQNDIVLNLLSVKNNLTTPGLKCNPEHERIAYHNFQKLRALEGNPNVKIIGIKIKSSNIETDISTKTIVDALNLILDNPDFFPVILIEPREEERLAANEINQFFDNSLVTIEADIIALPSVINNLDLLITPETKTKQISSLFNVPTIELHTKPKDFYKHFNYQENLIIIFSKTSDIEGKYIYDAICDLLFQKTINWGQHKNIHCFRPVRDELGLILLPLNQEQMPISSEIRRILSRICLAKFNNIQIDTKVHFDHLNNYQHNLRIMSQEKEKLAALTRHLLKALRMLVRPPEQIVNPDTHLEETLKEILEFEGPDKSIAGICSSLFKIYANKYLIHTAADSTNAIEKELFVLKRYVQISFEVIKHFESYCLDVKNTNLINNVKTKSSELRASY